MEYHWIYEWIYGIIGYMIMENQVLVVGIDVSIYLDY